MLVLAGARALALTTLITITIVIVVVLAIVVVSYQQTSAPNVAVGARAPSRTTISGRLPVLPPPGRYRLITY